MLLSSLKAVVKSEVKLQLQPLQLPQALLRVPKAVVRAAVKEEVKEVAKEVVKEVAKVEVKEVVKEVAKEVDKAEARDKAKVEAKVAAHQPPPAQVLPPETRQQASTSRTTAIQIYEGPSHLLVIVIESHDPDRIPKYEAEEHAGYVSAAATIFSSSTFCGC